jgi:hypothetical protein
MKVVKSPICSTTRRDTGRPEPRGRSHPSAKDSVPGPAEAWHIRPALRGQAAGAQHESRWWPYAC